MSRRLRVLVALATVAAMLLSLAGFASAQFSDVDADADYADAVELLAELKVAQGYPDGTFGVNNNMTRQEFAAFVVRAMGREAMAQSFSNARTAFRDDAEIAPWARGYVYVATQARIINGYPDGTFRPNGQVTQAEAITMIVRALGFSAYAEKLGAWPTGYLLAAEELGVSDGLTVVAGLPMTRGEMAIALKNALAASYQYNANTNELDRVDNGENSWLRKAHGFSASRWREVAGDISKVTGEFKRFRTGDRIELASGDVYDLAHDDDNKLDVDISFNDGAAKSLDLSSHGIKEGDRVTLTLNNDDEVTKIAVFRYDIQGLVEAIDLEDDEEEYGTITVDGEDLSVDPDTTIVVDGKEMTLAELDEADVVGEAFARVASEDEAKDYAVEIQVFTNTVRGKVERVGRDRNGTYVILDVDGDDEKYYYDDKLLRAAEFEPGSTVTVVLDGDDVVVATVDTTPAATLFYAIAVSRSSSGVTFERADGSEFVPPSDWDVSTVTVGSVYQIDTEEKKVSPPAAADVAVEGTLETIGSTYIRVKVKEEDDSERVVRVNLAEHVIVEKDGDPFKSLSSLRKGDRVKVYTIDIDGADYAEYILVPDN